MADIVIMGGGLSGAIMAYEMKSQMRPEDRLTGVTKDPLYHFVPSNPWVPVGWRKREALEVDLAPTFAKRGIGFKASPVTKVSPKDNTIETADGAAIHMTIVIATGPELAFDEVEGLGQGRFGPGRSPTSTTRKRRRSLSRSSATSRGRSSSARRRAPSCFGPAYEFMFIVETELQPSQNSRSGADYLCHHETLCRSPRPRRRRRHQGSAGDRQNARAPHQMDHLGAHQEGRTGQDDG